jgi:hypothetical protein
VTASHPGGRPSVPTGKSFHLPPTYIAGQLSNDPQNLLRWIQDPQAVEPGTAMPDLGVGPEVARDMAAYLYSIR